MATKKTAKKSAATKVVLKFYFKWSGAAPCSVRYLYVNGHAIAAATTSPARGPIVARVKRRSSYLVEWGLEFQGAKRRSLELMIDKGGGALARVDSAPLKDHFWAGRKKA